ncbi:MAG: DinB family protein [Chloroflexi bacterium]|nr:DinB family protein [Chloroflexota bacterium]
MNREEITAAIRGLPDALDALLEGLPDDDLRRRPSPDAWSILEVLCHLRDSAEIEGRRVRRLVEEDEPALAPYDQEALARERDYQGDDPRRVRTAVRAFWGGLAYQLERLSDEQWQRGGTHPEQGRVTVASRAERMALHAREHTEQIAGLRGQM